LLKRNTTYLCKMVQKLIVIVKVSQKDRADYKARLTYSLRCLRFLLNQELAFRGHDKTEQSVNRGNFLELLN
jgi:hypothetical protein